MLKLILVRTNFGKPVQSKTYRINQVIQTCLRKYLIMFLIPFILIKKNVLRRTLLLEICCNFRESSRSHRVRGQFNGAVREDVRHASK